MQQWLALLVLALATWRVTSLIVNEDGPKDILARFRHFIGVRYDQDSQPYGLNVVASALTCVWCTSPYIATLFWILYLVAPVVSTICLTPFALSAAAIIVESIVKDK